MTKRRSLVPLVMATAMLAGCATAPQDTASVPASKKTVRTVVRHAPPPVPRAQAEPKIVKAANSAKPAKPVPLPDTALLQRQPAPDCELKTQPVGDATEVRLKTLDYERQCYKEVEGAVRAKLDKLQDAVGETIKAVKTGDSTEAVGSIGK